VKVWPLSVSTAGGVVTAGPEPALVIPAAVLSVVGALITGGTSGFEVPPAGGLGEDAGATKTAVLETSLRAMTVDSVSDFSVELDLAGGATGEFITGGGNGCGGIGVVVGPGNGVVGVFTGCAIGVVVVGGFGGFGGGVVLGSVNPLAVSITCGGSNTPSISETHVAHSGSKAVTFAGRDSCGVQTLVSVDFMIGSYEQFVVQRQ
jgi:hypothetical protein